MKVLLAFSKKDFEYSLRSNDFDRIIFVGEFCFETSDEIKKYEYVKNPITSEKYLNECANYLDDLLERLNSPLTNALNEYYDTAYSCEFWNIATRTYLLHWISSYYFKYLCLKKACSTNEHIIFYCRGLKHPSKIVPKDLLDLMKLIKDDEYNQEQFIEIARELSFQIIEDDKQAVEMKWKFNKIREKVTPRRFLKDCLKYCVNFLMPRFYIGEVQGLTQVDKIKFLQNIILKKNKKTINMKNCFWTKKRPRKSMEKIELIFTPINDFESIVQKNLFKNLNLDLLKEIPSQSYDKRKKYWIGNDIYLGQGAAFQIARVKESGGQWISVQHGGAYGHLKSFPLGQIEYRLTDAFVTWGWDKCSQVGWHKGIALPSPHLSKLIALKKVAIKKEKIVFIETGMFRQVYRFQSYLLVDTMVQYKNDQLLFFKNLNPRYFENVIIKKYPQNFYSDTILNDFIDKNGIKISKSNAIQEFVNAGLVIVDHCSTSFLEVLSINTPLILYWRKNICELDDVAAFYFNELREVGIWHESPESGAQFVNSLNGNWEEWWNTDIVQKARSRFVEKYALTSTKYLDQWADFFKQYEIS